MSPEQLLHSRCMLDWEFCLFSRSRCGPFHCCACADIIAASGGAAQLLIPALFKVVKTAQPSALPPVRTALALCFERQPRSAAYVGALQRLAIEDRGGAVDPAEVASAAVQSGSLQSGALQVLNTALTAHVKPPAGSLYVLAGLYPV